MHGITFSSFRIGNRSAVLGKWEEMWGPQFAATIISNPFWAADRSSQNSVKVSSFQFELRAALGKCATFQMGIDSARGCPISISPP